MTLSFEEAQQGVVQICRSNSADAKSAGTGFLMAPGYILTCAHVVNAAISVTSPQVGDTVYICFSYRARQEHPGLSEEPQASVVVDFGFEADRQGMDWALLKLQGNPSPALPIAQLQPWLQPDNEPDSQLQIFGYPSEQGLIVRAVARGYINGPWVQIEDTKVTGAGIEPGLSGSPVWSFKAQAWVGMVVAREQYRESEKIGYMIPDEQLKAPQRKLQADSLLDILLAYEETLAPAIQLAYEVSRPDRSKSLAVGLREILSELSPLGAAGDRSVNRLIEFAMGLLAQGLAIPQPVEQKLRAWVEFHASPQVDVAALGSRMLDKLRSHQDEKGVPVKPCLWVKVEADKVSQGEPYQINAWFVPDPSRYQPNQGKGSEPLASQGWEDYVNETTPPKPEKGWCYEHLPILLATYLDFLGRKKKLALEDLTVEIFLPSPLANEAIELTLIPSESEDWLDCLIHDHRSSVILRLQERLERNRLLGTWERKWKQLNAAALQPSPEMFIPGCDAPRQLRSNLNDALGLKLDYSPKLASKGELDIILLTGTPAALWVRCDASDAHWVGEIDRQVLHCVQTQQPVTIKDLPAQVAQLRQETPHPDEVENVAESSDLGHRLSFLWENPRHVPPEIDYIQGAETLS